MHKRLIYSVFFLVIIEASQKWLCDSCVLIKICLMLSRLVCFHTCLFRLSEKSFVLFIQYPPDEGRPLATSSLAQPLRGLKTYSTLRFMRSTCGKSSVFCFYRFDSWDIVFICSLFVMSCHVTRRTLVPKLAKNLHRRIIANTWTSEKKFSSIQVAKIWRWRSQHCQVPVLLSPRPSRSIDYDRGEILRPRN